MLNCRELIKHHHLFHFDEDELNCLLKHQFLKDVGEFAREIKSYSKISAKNKLCNISAKELSNIGISFHQRAGTFTEKVRIEIKKIQDNLPKIIIPHQPNLFPSMGVIAPFLLGDIISKSLLNDYKFETVLVYLIIDYDLANDRRFRSSKFPDPMRKSGSLSLSNCVNKSKNSLLMRYIDKPEKKVVESWFFNLEESIKQQLNCIKKLGEINNSVFKNYRDFIHNNFDILKLLMWDSYSRSKTLTELNSIFLSKIINIMWGLGIVFVNGSSVQSCNYRSIKWALSNSKKIIKAADAASSKLRENGIKINMRFNTEKGTLFWYYCKRCRKRSHLFTSKEAQIFVEHCCDQSESIVKSEITKDFFSIHKDIIIPKVIIDNIFDIISLNAIGSTGYIGQAEHVIISNLICNKLNIRPFPRLIFRASGLQLGIAEILSIILLQKNILNISQIEKSINISFSGKASILYYIISLGFEYVKYSWQQYMLETKNIHIPKMDSTISKDFPLYYFEEHLISIKNLIFKEISS